MLCLILLLAALICFLLAAFNIGGSNPKVNLVALGLALLAAYWVCVRYTGHAA